MKNENKITAIIGGTFDVMHDGHKEYIKTAFKFADFVYIMLNTKKYANKKYQVKSYKERYRNISNYIRSLELDSFEILEISNYEYLIQFCSENDIDLAIVTPEYINFMRGVNLRSGKKFYLLVLEKVRDKDNIDLNSTAINLKG